MALAPDQQELHRAIGLVYDSALDPGIWPVAIEAMCGLIDGACYGSISVMDPVGRENRLAREWCPDPAWPQWRKLLDEKYEALMPFYGAVARLDVGAIHSTVDVASLVGMTLEQAYQHPFFKEWALPQGRHDTLGCVLMRSANRAGYFAVHIRSDRDLVTAEDRAMAELLTPHIRRAVNISDVLDMTAMKAATLQATLDTLRAAVVVTDADARVVFCNSAGDAMLRTGAPVGTQDGQLRAKQAAATKALRTAIGQTVNPVSSIGINGIGVPLRTGDGSPAVAHVLPLAQGGQYRDFGPRASAAVFVAPVEHALPEADALTALYGLTMTEARVLLEIASGKRRAEAAAALGIADNTAKTHLDRVFSKTGVSDQGALARLVASLGSPARRVE